MKISLIAAVADNGVIGKNNQLVWNLPLDTRFFMKTTQGHCILTGRRNYESIPEKFRPLKKRTNIVVTRRANYAEEQPTRRSPKDGGGPELKIVHTVKEGIELARKMGEKELFVIGGGQIYKQTIHLAHCLYITEVKHTFQGDAYFPSFDKSQWEETSRIVCAADEENAYEMHFTTLERV